MTGPDLSRIRVGGVYRGRAHDGSEQWRLVEFLMPWRLQPDAGDDVVYVVKQGVKRVRRGRCRADYFAAWMDDEQPGEVTP